MTLKRRGRFDHRQFYARWPAVDRSPFATSAAYDILAAELDRYLRDEVRGRSFLIAGHRGAGKTFLVRNVVERAHLQIFSGAEIAVKTGEVAKGWVNVQRPLLVQIHGPSLLAPPKDEASESARDLAAKGMAQVMIALFRAAAEEYCNAFSNHVPNLPAPRRAGMMELAAQLRLDLDMGAEPARLREYWQRFGRLGPGLLWPAPIAIARGPGQGVAEIVALATAGQAFQVCAGELKLKRSASEGAKRDASIEASAGTPPGDGVKDVSDKFFALGAGGAAAAAAWGSGSSTFAALAGLATALATTFGLKFAGQRSLNSARSTAYEFLPDTSLETLDRDLPLIIRRLREAGLAPVFVIDELDKLAPGRESDSVMAKLIDRLKLLTTDHGFFCFLTDRNYYESVRRRASTNGYAREHTHFSSRLLISYAPRDFRNYAYDVLQWPENEAEVLEREIFVSQLMHRAELNFIDFSRLLNASLPQPNEVSGPDARSPAPIIPSGSRLDDQWHAVIQLAIEQVWRDPALQARMAGDGSFAQLSADALYLISRRWKKDSDSPLDLNSAPIIAYLLGRMAGDDRGRSGNAGHHAETLQDFNISKDRQDTLVDAVQKLAWLLCNFNALQAAVSALPDAEKPLLKIFQTINGTALLADQGSFRYRFLYDDFGVNIDFRDGMRPSETLSDLAFQTAKDLHVYALEVIETMNDLGTNLETLASAGALPPSLPWRMFERLTNNVAAALDQKLGYFGMAADCENLTSCESALQQRGDSLALSLQLGVMIAVRGQQSYHPVLSPELPQIGCNISPFARHLGADWNSMTASGDGQRQTLITTLKELLSTQPGTQKSLHGGFHSSAELRAWRAELPAWHDFVIKLPGRSWNDFIQAAWDRWLPPVTARLTATPFVPEPHFEDFWLDAAGHLPSTLFRRDLENVSLLDWSLLTLHGAMAACGQPSEAPLWAMAAGLRALGIDGATIPKVFIKASTPVIKTPERGIERLLQNAAPAEDAFLHIIKNHTLPPDASAAVSPGLYVDETDIEAFDDALAWLRDSEIFDEVIYER